MSSRNSPSPVEGGDNASARSSPTLSGVRDDLNLTIPSPALTPALLSPQRTPHPSTPSSPRLHRVTIQDNPSTIEIPRPAQVASPTARSVFSFFTMSRPPSPTSDDEGQPRHSAFSSTQTLGSVKSYRSTSSNSPIYMFKDPMKSSKELPYEQTTLSDEDFDVFATLARDQQTHKAPGFWTKLFTRTLYVVLIASVVYFVLVGMPLWKGGVRWFWKFEHDAVAQGKIYGLVAFLLAGSVRNWLPQFLCTYNREEPGTDPEKPRDASECCVVIPCYKSAETLRSTIPACLEIFRPEQIFVVANGNSPTPLDHTAVVCAEYGVRHIWVPVGSKITAEFVGVALAREYKYCMLIDDDVLLPANMPFPTEVFAKDNKIACIGYTIKSVGPDSSKGTIIQQVQDIEYKVAGLAKVFQSWYGSVIFPHGAVALWRRDVLEKIFHAHPGYHISEDWYLGHTARAAGYRIVMNSQVFVETETPPRLFPAIFAKKGGSRGGYGEMSIYKQRFFRWNFFFIFRIWSNVAYLVFSWRLGWRELITKLWIAGEVYDSLIMLLAPIALPIALAASWRITLIMMGGLLGANFLVICWFNIVHLWLLRRHRPKNERVAWIAFPAYMMVKFVMVFVNVASVYWSLYEYALFFTRQHLRVTESVAAWQVIRDNMRQMDQRIQLAHNSDSE